MKLNIKRAASVVATIGIASMLLTGCSGSPSTPQDVVKGYLEAVQKGDSKAALALIQPDDKYDKSMLTDEVLKGSKKIKNVKLYDALGKGSDSTISVVKANFDIGGKTITAKFNSVQIDGKWVVSQGDSNSYDGITLPFSEYVSSVAVNGVGFVSGKKFDGSTVFALFPGTYKVKLKNNQFLSLTEGATHQTGDSGASYMFKLTDGVQTSLEAASKKFIDECFAATDRANRNQDCPNWKAVYAYQVRDPKWFLIEYPKVTATYGHGVIEGSTEAVSQKLTYTYGPMEAGLSGEAGQQPLEKRYLTFESKLKGDQLTWVPVHGATSTDDPRLFY